MISSDQNLQPAWQPARDRAGLLHPAEHNVPEMDEDTALTDRFPSIVQQRLIMRVDRLERPVAVAKDVVVAVVGVGGEPDILGWERELVHRFGPSLSFERI